MATMATSSSSTEFVSVTDASGMIGLSVGRIRQLLLDAESTLKGYKVSGRAWIISRAELKKYAKKNGLDFRDNPPAAR